MLVVQHLTNLISMLGSPQMSAMNIINGQMSASSDGSFKYIDELVPGLAINAGVPGDQDETHVYYETQRLLQSRTI